MGGIRSGSLNTGDLTAMNLKYTLIALALLPLAVAAETQRFRSGEILCAELSKGMPFIRNRSAADLSNLPDKKIYAALTVSLDAGRRISIYDYSLKAFDVLYRCVALRNGDNTIDGAKYESNGNGKKSRCTLYFVLNAREVGLGKLERLRLICNVPPVSEQFVVFTNRGSLSFTHPMDIPESGIMASAK